MRTTTLRSILLAGGAAFALSWSALAQTPPASPQGFITVKEFLNIGGVTIADLTNNVKFPDSPDILAYPSFFLEWPAGADEFTPPNADVKNNYGVQMLGYYYPPATGNYIFYIAADDYARLYLSTDATEANKKLIALEPEWNPVRDWLGVNRRNATNPENDSSKYLATEWATPDPVNGGAIITLTANQPYFIEALMKEGGGGDNLAIAIQDPGLNWDTISPQSAARASTIDLTLGNASVRTQPLSQTVEEGTPVGFRTAPNGTPPFTYQWRKAGVEITDETNLFYNIPFASFADNGVAFSVVITGGAGAPATSADAILTVNQDTTAPTVVEASGGSDFVTVRVLFSERVDISAATWAISGGITVSGTAQPNASTVILTTSRQAEGQVYTLTINGVRDMAATPNTIAAATVVNFNSAIFSPGLVAWERWNGGGAILQFIDDIANNALGVSDVQWITAGFESGRSLADNYRGRGYTWFKPAVTGDYVFIITVDDNARLFLSSDEDPANKLQIAAEGSWSNNREWSSATEEQRSDSYLETLWPDFWTITLTQGNTYYLEALWQEGGGGDGCEVTIIPPGGTTPANGTASALTGSLVGVFVDPSTLPPVITGRPRQFLAADTTIYDRGDTLTFQVEATSSKPPLTYQWYRSQIPIPGATGATLTIANAGPEAVGDYSVRVSNPNGTVDSFPDNDARARMTGAFVIEGEDYNHTIGQHVAAASDMATYRGGGYDGLEGVLDIDLWQNGDDSGGSADANRYNRNPLAADYHLELANEGGGNLERPDFTMTAGFKIGWTRTAAWQNYTRTIPKAGTYIVFDAASYDARNNANIINHGLSLVANPIIADGSAVGVEGGQQGLTRLGTFTNPGSGGWSNLDLIPLRNADGSLSMVDLPAGNVTFRVTYNKNDGDFDYLLLYEASVAGPSLGPISFSGGNVSIPFTGTLWSADVITGPWTAIAGATSPYSAPPSGTQKFYQSQSAP